MSSENIKIAAALLTAVFLAAGVPLTATALVADPGTTAAQQAKPGETPSESAPQHDNTPEQRLYVVLFTTGPGFIADAGSQQPGIAEHREFIMGLHADDVVPLGGPLFDDDHRERISGVLYFVRAGSLEEARETALQEPMVKTRVIEIVSVREFLTGVGRGRLD